MTTVADILTASARAIGYLGMTEVMSAADANNGLNCFNRMLDSWSNESLTSYVTLQRSFSLIAGQQAYTIGAGGYISSTRPYDIINAFIRDNNANDYPMRIITFQEWYNIGEKTITSQIPDTLYYSSAYPLGTIYIFPIPLVNYTCFFRSTTDQVDYTLLTTALSLPVGYERAYVLNLALELQTAGYPVLLDDKSYMRLVNNAAEAKGNIKRANIKEVIATYDPAIVSRSQASYNIYSDTYPRN
jgi:hypothetical protein